MNYLHEAIIQAIEHFIEQCITFSAHDVTRYVRDMELSPEDIVDADHFINLSGENFVQVEHSRVKSLVHLYMKNYNPNLFQKSDNGRYITYTPVGVSVANPTYDPWGYAVGISSPLGFGDFTNPKPLDLTPKFDWDIKKGSPLGSSTTVTLYPKDPVAPVVTQPQAPLTKPSLYSKEDQKLIQDAFDILVKQGIVKP